MNYVRDTDGAGCSHLPTKAILYQVALGIAVAHAAITYALLFLVP